MGEIKGGEGGEREREGENSSRDLHRRGSEEEEEEEEEVDVETKEEGTIRGNLTKANRRTEEGRFLSQSSRRKRKMLCFVRFGLVGRAATTVWFVRRLWYVTLCVCVCVQNWMGSSSSRRRLEVIGGRGEGCRVCLLCSVFCFGKTITFAASSSCCVPPPSPA